MILVWKLTATCFSFFSKITMKGSGNVKSFLSMSYQTSIWIFWLLPREMRNRFSLIHWMYIGHWVAQGRSYCNYHFIDEQQCRGINRLVLQEEQICFSLWSVIQQTHLGHIYQITAELRWGVLLLPDIPEAKYYMEEEEIWDCIDNLLQKCSHHQSTSEAFEKIFISSFLALYFV